MRHSQKLKELERRRRRGARLLATGESQAEVARRLGVSRQTVMRWDRAREEGGMEALRRAPRFGRPDRLSAAQRHELVRLLKEGALSAGFPTELWTLPRIAQLIEAKFAVKMLVGHVDVEDHSVENCGQLKQVLQIVRRIGNLRRRQPSQLERGHLLRVETA